MTDRIEKTIELKAPIEKVWDALADHDQFGRWFRVKLEGPFIAGKVARGRITHPGYEHLVWEATILRMERPHLFSMTWHPYAVDPKVDYSKEPPTLVEFKLKPTATGTQLTLVESGFEALPKHRLSEALRMNDMGWTQQMKNIQTHVES